MIHAASSSGFITAVSNGANDVDLQLRALNGGAANSNQLVLDSEGNVGIGTDSPSSNKGSGTASTLHLYTNAASPELRIQRDGGADFSIIASTTGGGSVLYSSHGMTFYTNSTTRAVDIDTSGNLLVGRESVGSTGAGHSIRGADSAIFSRDGGEAVILNRDTSDGTIAEFRKDGTTVGTIGTGSASLTRLQIGTGDTNLFFQPDADYIGPSNGTAVRDAAIDLGFSAARWKDLYLSSNAHVGNYVYFGGGSSYYVHSDNNNYLRFGTAGAERVRIGSNGDVFLTPLQ